MDTGQSIRPPQKQSGAYFTPDDIAAALVRWALRHDDDRLLDPSCGDGNFLVHHRNSVGIEQDFVSARSAMDRAPWSLVHEGDFFTWAAETSERFECAAGNPPFIRYQTFKGDMRKRALAHCLSHGARFSGLTSSWAPFLVSTATLLKAGGRLAFVVPAEIGHAPYAAPLIEYLVASFRQVKIVAVRQKLFPQLSEDCWLLYADGFGEKTDRIELSVVDQYRPAAQPPAATTFVNVGEWRSIWNSRLRPYLISEEVRGIYQVAAADPDSRRFSEFAAVGIGYVSGDNDFFHLKPSLAEKLGIPTQFLKPSVRNARSLPKDAITQSTVTDWQANDQAMLLLKISRGQEVPATVRRYLNSNPGREARQAYKCRVRDPWYSVPDVQEPDYILQYMSGRAASLVKNDAGVTCTNSVHAVRLRDRKLAAKLLPSWETPFVRLSCEIEGHALGGGMLKLEPREAGNILFPAGRVVGKKSSEAILDSIQTLQRWRHYAD